MDGSQATAASLGRRSERFGVRFCRGQEKVEDMEILINTHRAGFAQGPTGCHVAGGPRAHGHLVGGPAVPQPRPAFRLPCTGRPLASQGPTRCPGRRCALPAGQDGVGAAGTRGLSLPCERPRRQRWGDPLGKLQAALGAARPLAPSVLGVHVHPVRYTSVSGQSWATWELRGGTSRDPRPPSPEAAGRRVPRPHPHTAPCLGRF